MKRKTRFEIFRGAMSDWYFRLVASNGQIICQSEGYTTKQNCKRGIEAVRKAAGKAEVVEV